jgi:xanthine dehydrogenase accessory factor
VGGDAVVIRGPLARRADALAAAREPYVTALVVRAQRPTSVRPGDAALVLRDGTIEGFVGGACAESTVRLHAARVLETGEPLLLRIVPGDGDEPAEEGAVTVSNECLSGGALEIFLEPALPPARAAVIGDTPVAEALRSLAAGLGFEVGAEPASGDAALVVASHGRDEEDALGDALSGGVPYVGLVASPRRGAALVEALRQAGVPVDRLRTPAGLDIGAVGADEIALSIVAEVVRDRHAAPRVEPTPVAAAEPVHRGCH